MPEAEKLTEAEKQRILELLQFAAKKPASNDPPSEEYAWYEEIRQQVLEISPLKGDELTAKVALLQEATSWAQHYSTVRMAVTTFLTTISLGIMQFRWDNPQPIHLLSSLAAWILLLILLFSLSSEEYEKISQQQQIKTKLGAHAKPSPGMWWDCPLWCFLALSVLYFIAFFFFWWPPTAALCAGG